MTQSVIIKDFVDFDPKILMGILSQDQFYELINHIAKEYHGEMFDALGNEAILEQADVIRGLV